MPSLCEFEGCPSTVLARGYCAAHYDQKRKGQVLRPVRRMRLSIAEKIERDTEEGEGGCLIWTGSMDRNGYGRLWHDGRHHPAHRASLELKVGAIPGNLVVNHICQRPACVNPDHLEAVTRGQNVQFQRPRRSLPRGVYLDKKWGRYYVQAQLRGELYYFGTFRTVEEAEAAAIAGRERIGMHDPRLEEGGDA